ncbi:MAG: Xaa-Pro aminopeptidase [Pseudomonadales bacterium]|nr:Xaa-Pro aminopeptidase [Pseudomonadales bacterium]
MISLREFRRRRQELMDMMDENCIAILPSARVMSRNSDVDYQFRQDSDFQYLAGFPEPEAVLVIIPGREHGETILFCRERDPEAERWHGKITGPERAMQLYGLDDAFPISDIDDILPGLIEGKSKLYYSMGANHDFDGQIIHWVNSISTNQQSGSRPPGEFSHLGNLIHELRLFKSKQELEVMRHAAHATAVGHKALMELTAPGRYEYQLEAALLNGFMMEGARSPAYPSIVGSGENANILHYTDNDAELKEGELVLIDAGAEYQCYACDVTRTIPVNGKFTEAQREVYEIVLAAQLAAIDMVRPENHWNQPHEAAVRVLTEGMVRLGLLEGDPAQLIEEEAYRKFYMHRTGHWLGLDVHDVGEYQIDGEWRVFEPGMVTTIEPGLYISEALKDVPARYRGIGVRIEDNVLVTRSGNEVLTSMIPKSVAEIEAAMAVG